MALTVAQLDRLFVLPVSALRRRAVAGGASADELDDADDCGQTREALVSLLVKQAASNATGAFCSSFACFLLRFAHVVLTLCSLFAHVLLTFSRAAAAIWRRDAQLRGMKTSQLRRAAVQAGAGLEQLATADDAGDRQEAMIELVMASEAAAVEDGHANGSVGARAVLQAGAPPVPPVRASPARAGASAVSMSPVPTLDRSTSGSRSSSAAVTPSPRVKVRQMSAFALAFHAHIFAHVLARVVAHVVPDFF